MTNSDLLSRIRALDINDAQEIARVNVISYLEADRRCPNPEQTNYNIDSHLSHNISRWRRKLGDLSDDSNKDAFLGIEEDGELKGFIHFGANKKNPDSAEIHALYVHPDHWESGAGKQLFKAAAKDLKAQGYNHLLLRTLRDDPIPNGFYRKMGFDLTRIFKQISGSRDVVYEMNLDGLEI